MTFSACHGLSYCGFRDSFWYLFIRCQNCIQHRPIQKVSNTRAARLRMVSCASGCGVFCAALAVILVVFALQISNGNQTFAVLASEGGWDVSQKAQCCYSAAIAYAVLSFVLLLWGRWKNHRVTKTKRRNAPHASSQSPPRDSSPLLSANRF